MKLILSTLLLFASLSTYSQSEQEMESERDQNREKALSVVAPIDEALDDLRANGQLPKPAPGTTLESMIESATNKVKMVDYSDKKFEEGYTKNDDGSWSPKENLNVNESVESINEEPYVHQPKQSISILSKIFTIIMLIILWFAVGFVINFIIYNSRPDHELGTSKTAKFLHILANIAVAIAILVTLSR